ncbi:MAG: glycoside hydrolase family 95-like protein [Rhodopirellula sp. JB044]|uniref:glycoside hydrolase family 95-like protein n=1 Tax=Rhodopirellula sp. JB044 TaxID=3342844 RepID=UPI00370C2B79
MLLQSHLRSVNPDATTIENAAFVAYRKDATNPDHFIPVVPSESIAEAPYILHLLPALPPAWPNGHIEGLRARGGCEVDVTWRNGALASANVRAPHGGSLRLYADGSLSKTIRLGAGETIAWPLP